MESVLCLDCQQPIPLDQPARPVRYTVKARRGYQLVRAFVHAGCRRRGVIRSKSGYVSDWSPSGEGRDEAAPAPCEHCGRVVILAVDPRRRRNVCSPRCAVAVTPSHQKDPEPRACSQCGVPLAGRADSDTCSPKCRQKAYRARKRATA